MGRLLFLLNCLWLSVAGAQAQPPVLVIDSAQTQVETGLWAEWLADPTRQLTLADVTRPAIGQRFRAVGKRYPNAGFTLDDYWLRVRVRVAAAPKQPGYVGPERLYFENTFPIATLVELFVLDSAGNLLETHRATSGHLGDRREVAHPHFVFTSLARPGQTLTVYVRSHNEMGLQYIPLTVWREAAFTDYTAFLYTGWGAYLGFGLLAVLLHLLMYVFTRERRYLLVGAVVVSYLLYETSRGIGLGVRYLWPNSPWLLTHGLNVFFTAWVLTYLLFFYEILELHRQSRGWQWLFGGLAVFNAVALLFSFSDWFLSRALVPTVQGSITVPAILLAGLVFVWRQGRTDLIVAYYVAGTLFLLSGGMVLNLSRSGVLNLSGNVSAMALSSGTILEICCFTLGVAAQSRRERRARRHAQQQQREAQLSALNEQRQRELEDVEARLLAQVTERRAIADNLHDNLGGLLFSLHSRISGLLNQPEGVTTGDLLPIRNLVLQTHQRVRLIAHNLVPEELSKQGGLLPALTAFTSELNEVSDTRFGIYIDQQARQLPLATQFALYNIAFELLQNVLKHAKATEASLQVRCTAKKIAVLTAQDNGIGVSKHALNDSRAFATIRRRTEQANGRFQVGAVSGGGTRVVVELPL